MKIRVCLHSTNTFAGAQSAVCPDSRRVWEVHIRKALAVYAPLREQGEVEIRLHRGTVYNSIYYADDQMVVSQHVYGTPMKSGPVLHLQSAEDSDMAAAFDEAFETVWATAVFAR